MLTRQIVTVLLQVICFTNVCRSQIIVDRICKKVDECSCKFTDTGGLVNLRNLASVNGLAAFPDEPAKDGYQYSYNPCVPFNEDDCANSAICKIRPGFNHTSESIADHSVVNFGYDGHNVQVSYMNPSGLRRVSFVSFVCVENLFLPKFTAYGQNGTDPNYYFQIETMCACEGACPTVPDDEGLSAGSVVLIIFFVLIGVYLVFGTLYGKIVRHASGLEMLPNYEFWSNLPGNVKNGCVAFVTCSCFGTSKKTYDEV